MNEISRDLIVKALGKALETEIKFITLVVTKAKIKDKARSVDKKIIICFGRTKIFILLESLDSVKAEFEYSAIKKVVLDKNFKNYLRIHLDPLKYPKSKSFFLRVKDRGFFVKNLMCYYSIYYMKYYGIVCDLLIKERDGVLSEKGSNIIKGGGVIHNTPDGFIIRTMKKYE
jgi:hypothetical protein